MYAELLAAVEAAPRKVSKRYAQLRERGQLIREAATTALTEYASATRSKATRTRILNILSDSQRVS